MSVRNFGHLGSSFQLQLMKVIIEDRAFASTVVEFMESSYFDNLYLKYIMQLIKEHYQEFSRIPSYETLITTIISEAEGKQDPKIHLDTLNDVRNNEEKIDTDYIKSITIKFCKQQVLKKELKTVQKIIDNGKFEDYDKIEEIIRNAIQVGVDTGNVTDIFDDIMASLEVDNRVPIPTGIEGIDNILLGGLAKGELGVILAPTGVGKTTILTKFANTAFNVGQNVLHIFFEDNKINIRQKHYTLWSGVSSYDQKDRKEEVYQKVTEAKERSKGKLLLTKMASDSTTIADIKSMIRKLRSEDFYPDLIIIDYVDCITSGKGGLDGEEWKGEGAIMRSLETMCDEFNVAIWVATQGSRDSIGADIVTANQMSGSIKKAFIGHVVISVAKTLEQKENKLANISILKSRIGPDGNVFENCSFDNEYLRISTEEVTTFLGFKEEKEQNKKNRANELFKQKLEEKNKIN